MDRRTGARRRRARRAGGGGVALETVATHTIKRQTFDGSYSLYLGSCVSFVTGAEITGMFRMSNVWGDLRYAFRSLKKSPVFMTIAILSLALGIGANTAIFTLLDQILLRLLPVKDAHQLTLLTMRGRHYGSNWGGNAISYPMYRDVQDHNAVLSGMFCRFPRALSLTFEGHTERVAAELVSGTYFPVLGVGAAIGKIG